MENSDSSELKLLKRLNKKELYDIIFEMYVKEKMLLKQIASVFNTTPRNIKQTITSLNIPRRTIKESRDIEYKNRKFFRLTKKRKQVLLGGLLGDGCLTKNGRNFNYFEFHCLKQKGYAEWKAKIFKVKIRKRVYYEKRIKGLDKNWRGRKGWFEQYGFSFSHPYLNSIYPRWYQEQKFLSWEMLKDLNSLGLAIWYLDDGYYRKAGRGCVSISHKFNSQKEEGIIINLFKNKFGLECVIKPREYCSNISFNVDNSAKLLEIVKPHIKNIPCMKYKMGEENA